MCLSDQRLVLSAGWYPARLDKLNSKKNKHEVNFIFGKSPDGSEWGYQDMGFKFIKVSTASHCTLFPCHNTLHRESSFDSAAAVRGRVCRDGEGRSLQEEAQRRSGWGDRRGVSCRECWPLRLAECRASLSGASGLGMASTCSCVKLQGWI